MDDSDAKRTQSLRRKSALSGAVRNAVRTLRRELRYIDRPDAERQPDRWRALFAKGSIKELELLWQAHVELATASLTSRGPAASYDAHYREVEQLYQNHYSGLGGEFDPKKELGRVEAVLYLRWVEWGEMDYAAIAEQLGTNRDRVRQLCESASAAHEVVRHERDRSNQDAAAPSRAVSNAKATESSSASSTLPYIKRTVDHFVTAALANGETLIAIQGDRHLGKTHLMRRLHQQFVDAGRRTALVNLSAVATSEFTTDHDFFRRLCEILLGQIATTPGLSHSWDGEALRRIAAEQFTLFVERILTADGPVTLLFDEADALLDRPCGETFFAMLRDWYTRVSKETRDARIHLVTTILAHTAYREWLIRDVTKSPFNAAAKCDISPFRRVHVEELNSAYHGAASGTEITGILALFDGHPLFTHRAIKLLAQARISWSMLRDEAASQTGPFGQLFVECMEALSSDSDLARALRQVLKERRCNDEALFHRLHGLGIVRGTPRRAALRCAVYRQLVEAQF